MVHNFLHVLPITIWNGILSDHECLQIFIFFYIFQNFPTKEHVPQAGVTSNSPGYIEAATIRSTF